MFDEKDFIAKYAHDITKRVTVVNPTQKDFEFQHVLQAGIDVATGKMKDEARTYRVPAGGKERFPGPVADHYLDQMSKIIAQDDGQIQHMIDWNLRGRYYDQLIVDVEDLINTYQPFESAAYLEKSEEAKAEEPAFSQAEHVFVGKGADEKNKNAKK